MLTVNKISKTYGLQQILIDVTFTINEGEHIGLIGPNGSGKSSLLRLIVGQERADSGHITFFPPHLRIGYLSQSFVPDSDLTFRQFFHDKIGDPDLLNEELTRIATKLANSPYNERLQIAFDETLAKLSQIDTARFQYLLNIFDLADLDENLPVHALSGGQKTRLSLVLILLHNPQLLILDEPTNHLDIEMLEWLEKWINEFKGGVLMVSHDRTFLDRTVSKILDLDPNTHAVREYAGNYTDYLEQFLAEQDKQWQNYRDQEYEIRRMKQDIARTREQAMSVERSTTPRQPNIRRLAKKVMKKAKSREKKMDRYLESDERVEKPKRSWQMKLNLEEAHHLGKDVLSLENLSVGYPGYPPLLKDLAQLIQAGERVIITGQNGAGKTTLLRTIVGQIKPLSGQFYLGASVKLGYMSQEQELLDPDLSALEMMQKAISINETDSRSFLHNFLFTGDDSLRPSAQLSFGERARLSLALLVAQGSNLLLLDEPINHLDIPSRSRFEEALSQFEGTIMAVVHDRYFIDRFATKIWDVSKNGIDVRLV